MLKEEYKNLPVQLDNLIEKSNAYTRIATRAADPAESLGELKTFTEDTLNELADNMGEFNEKINSFGRQNSFHTNKLMTLQMLSKGSPYRVLRQCMSQIERKRGAVKESLQNLKKKKIEAQQLLDNIKDIDEDVYILNQKLEKYKNDKTYVQSMDDIEINEEVRRLERKIRDLNYDKQYKEIELEELQASTADMRVYLEGAFKEIGSFQQAYKEICKNKGIPEDWDEEDFEKYEPRYHIRHIFQNGFRDMMSHGRMGMGTQEHSIQMGLNPIQVEMEIQKFISNEKDSMYRVVTDGNGNKKAEIKGDADFTRMDNWLDDMEEKYKEAHKDAMKSLGLDNIVNDKYLYHNPNKQLE